MAKTKRTFVLYWKNGETDTVSTVVEESTIDIEAIAILMYRAGVNANALRGLDHWDEIKETQQTEAAK